MSVFGTEKWLYNDYYQSLINTIINEYKRMFILTDRKSFNAVEGCVTQVREGRDDSIAVLIVGNKVDLQVQNIS